MARVATGASGAILEPDLYSRVVEPAEAQFFAQMGGGKPLFRTAQVFEMGSSLALGGVLGAVALGVVIALSARPQEWSQQIGGGGGD